MFFVAPFFPASPAAGMKQELVSGDQPVLLFSPPGRFFGFSLYTPVSLAKF